jgi:hypothetical protein
VPAISIRWRGESGGLRLATPAEFRLGCIGSLRGHWVSRDGARYAVDLVVELRADFSRSRKFKSDDWAWEELALLLGCHRLTLVAIHGQLRG